MNFTRSKTSCGGTTLFFITGTQSWTARIGLPGWIGKFANTGFKCRSDSVGCGVTGGASIR